MSSLIVGTLRSNTLDYFFHILDQRVPWFLQADQCRVIVYRYWQDSTELLRSRHSTPNKSCEKNMKHMDDLKWNSLFTKYDMWFVRLSEDMWYDRITFVYLPGRHPTLSQRRAFETCNFALPHANAAELLGGQGQNRWAVEDQTSQRHQKILNFEIAKGSVQRQMNHKILWVYGVRLPEYVWIPCALVSTYLCLSGIPPRNS